MMGVFGAYEAGNVVSVWHARAKTVSPLYCLLMGHWGLGDIEVDGAWTTCMCQRVGDSYRETLASWRQVCQRMVLRKGRGRLQVMSSTSCMCFCLVDKRGAGTSDNFQPLPTGKLFFSHLLSTSVLFFFLSTSISHSYRHTQTLLYSSWRLTFSLVRANAQSAVQTLRLLQNVAG